MATCSRKQLRVRAREAFGLQLDDQTASCMMQALCPGEEGESIFDPGSKMGLQADEAKDHWHYDSSNASWTRSIVVPRAVSSIRARGQPKRNKMKARSYRACEIADGLSPIE